MFAALNLNPGSYVALGVLALFLYQNRDKVRKTIAAFKNTKPAGGDGVVPTLLVEDSPQQQAGRFPQLTGVELQECLVRLRFMASQLTDADNAEAVKACNVLQGSINKFTESNKTDE